MNISINNFTHYSILVSASVAGVCHLINSPKLNKIKNIAIGISLAGAAVYGYLEMTKKTNTSPRSPQDVSPTRPASTHAAPTPISWIEGSKNQKSTPTKHGCTPMAGVALVAMLKEDARTGPALQTKDQIDDLVDQGSRQYTETASWLEKEGFKEAGKDSLLSWDQCYHRGFEQELVTVNGGHRLIATRIHLSPTDTEKGESYLQVLQQLKKSVKDKPRGGILILGQSTYAVSISPAGRVRFFDSHGTFPWAQNASIREFQSIEALAAILQKHIPFRPNANTNESGLHPCWLRD